MVYNYGAIFVLFFKLLPTLIEFFYKVILKVGSGSALRKQLDPDPHKINGDQHP